MQFCRLERAFVLKLLLTYDCYLSTYLICYSVIETFIFYQAARETGALQAAKNKLEKQVEDLTLRLTLEKRRRVDIYYFKCELLTVVVLLYQTGSFPDLC